jgi:transmembrane sensor
LHDRFYAKVLGTAFNVKVYGEKDVRVTVTRGKVEVGRENKSYTVLTRDKEIILPRKAIQNAVAVRSIDAQKVSDWMSHKIHLYDVSFEDIILSIEDNYDVQVSYPEDLMKRSISTLHYSSDKSLQEVLEIIKMIHKLDYKVEGKEVYLIKK